MLTWMAACQTRNSWQHAAQISRPLIMLTCFHANKHVGVFPFVLTNMSTCSGGGPSVMVASLTMSMCWRKACQNANARRRLQMREHTMRVFEKESGVNISTPIANAQTHARPWKGVEVNTALVAAAQTHAPPKRNRKQMIGADWDCASTCAPSKTN